MGGWAMVDGCFKNGSPATLSFKTKPTVSTVGYQTPYHSIVLTVYPHVTLPPIESRALSKTIGIRLETIAFYGALFGF